MAKKETTKKKATKKTTTKRAYNKKVEKPVEEVKVVEEKPIEIPTVQVVNGDPSVLEPVGESEFISTEMLMPEEIKPETKKEEGLTPDVTSLVAEEIVTEVQPEEYESAKPAKKKEENNHKPSRFRRILGYFWNGQEID